MGSNARYGDRLLANRTPGKPCLVNLTALFPAPGPALQREGVVLRGWAPGAVHRWIRSVDGRWLAEVTYVIARHDGSTFRAERQLVSADALRPDAARERQS